MKIAIIIGARPQFIKHSMLAAAVEKYNNETGRIDTFVIHTGQHYNYEMSKIFFDGLKISEPDYNLGAGSGSHAVQTAEMIIGIEGLLIKEKPDIVLVYGDTNSTLAGSLTAAKLNIPIAHVEAGLRSYNNKMPEEINRVLTDRVSRLLFCPTKISVNNLYKEGITEGVYFTGDVMYDSVLSYSEKIDENYDILHRLGIRAGEYCLFTLHRAENTDDIRKMNRIFASLANLKDYFFVFPCHPRTGKVIKQYNIEIANNILLIDPIGYLEMLALEKNAQRIITDSGGVQKEAFFFEVPCVTLREETEWIETINAGMNLLVGDDGHKIVQGIQSPAVSRQYGSRQSLFGDGKAAEQIIYILGQI